MNDMILGNNPHDVGLLHVLHVCPIHRYFFVYHKFWTSASVWSISHVLTHFAIYRLFDQVIIVCTGWVWFGGDVGGGCTGTGPYSAHREQNVACLIVQMFLKQVWVHPQSTQWWVSHNWWLKTPVCVCPIYRQKQSMMLCYTRKVGGRTCNVTPKLITHEHTNDGHANVVMHRMQYAITWHETYFICDSCVCVCVSHHFSIEHAYIAWHVNGIQFVRWCCIQQNCSNNI